jgi:hypothetical protein
MLTGTAKSRRFLDLTQLVLSFASVCAVIDASGVMPQAHSTADGYRTTVPSPRETDVDRRFNDLARTERQRREAEQLASRGRAGMEAARTRG